MTTRLPAAERRATLIDTAIAVFSSEGYRSTTMEAIAGQAGVTKPVLYNTSHPNTNSSNICSTG